MSANPSQADVSQSPWVGRGHISTFVHCLHLLDLDKLEDWPGVTEATLTVKTAQQNLQHRVKAVEWSLYRLFELYDANETKNKLRPFFPPGAPLQSLNLRAALYRCLTELKKNGVLGREILLRKTMLDECKGDKFEETIAAFAMIVLRKSLKDIDGAMHRVVSGKTDATHVLPLILAYRKSLQDNLNKRHALRQRYLDQSGRLEIVEQDLKQRIVEVGLTRETTTPTVTQELEELVNTNWIGDQRWTEILLCGPPIKSAFDDSDVDGGVTRPSEQTTTSSSATSALLVELDTRIHMHQSRLAKWKLIARGLEAQRGRTNIAQEARPPVKPRMVQSKFTKHQKLNIVNDTQTPNTPSTITPHFQTLLVSMRQELSNKEINSDSPVAQENRSSLENGTADDKHSRDPDAEFATPAITQVDHYSLEQEALGAHGSETLPSDIDAFSKHIDIQHSPFPSSPISSLFDGPSSSWIPEHKSSATTVKTGSPSRHFRPHSPTLQQINNKQIQSPSSPTKDWLSLLDRTRASMASFNSYKHPLDSDPIDQSTDTTELMEVEEHFPLSSTPHLPSTESSQASLMERTRQSMSLLSNPNTNSKIRSRNPLKDRTTRSSQLFPRNPCEPSRYDTSAFTFREADEHPDSRSSTPRDKLFDAEADYASVFKSRPKIAVSPALSPERSGFDFDSGLEKEMEGLGLGSPDDKS